MKRLLCILSSLNVGGAETFMMKIFRALPSEYKIDFVVSADSGDYEEEVLGLGGKIYRIPLRTKESTKVFAELKGIVKENNYRYVLKLCNTPLAGYFDMLACKHGGAEVLALRSCNANSFEGASKRLVNALLRKSLNKLTTVKLAPSELAARYTFGDKEVNRGNVKLLHNAVDLAVYKLDKNARTEIRQNFGISENDILVGHIGRFNRQKNHKRLIEIFKALNDKSPNTRLILIGKGELFAETEEQISRLGLNERVILTGVRSDVPKLLSAMDVLLLPSFHEGMPNVVIEAQATGLPCLISDTITKEADITGLVKYVSLEEPNDIWAEKTLKLLEANGQRGDMTECFRKQRYDIESIVEEFVRLIFGDGAFEVKTDI